MATPPLEDGSPAQSWVAPPLPTLKGAAGPPAAHKPDGRSLELLEVGEKQMAAA